MVESAADRLRKVRELWAYSQANLATRTGLPLNVIWAAESDATSLSTAELTKLAEALQVRAEWLRDGTGDMLNLWNLTPDAQIAAQTGPGTEGLPGFAVMEGGAWYRDDDGAWVVDVRSNGRGIEYGQ